MKSQIILIGLICLGLAVCFQQCAVGGSDSSPLQLGQSSSSSSGSTTGTTTTGTTTGAVTTPTAVTWQNLYNVGTTTTSLYKGDTDGWTNGAVSVQGIPSGRGYIEFTTIHVGSPKMGGLSYGDRTHSYQDINFAIYLTSAGTVQIYENGTQIIILGNHAFGDVFRVAVDNSVVRYYKNGSLIHVSSQTPRYPLFFDAALHGPNSSIVDPKIQSDAGLRDYSLISGGPNGFGDGTNFSRTAYCPGGTTTSRWSVQLLTTHSTK